MDRVDHSNRSRLTNPRGTVSLDSMSVKEIEAAIRQLPAKELEELLSWLADYRAQVWDRQIEDDLEQGRLDALLSEVDREIESGLAKEL